MIRSLRLIDFMAHADSLLELDPGLNVLCGPNNTGKSAVVEALRGLCANPSSARHVIRHGAREARVEALFEDGSRVAWVRRGKHALYEVSAPGGSEPRVYAKLGKSAVPADVEAAVRLPMVSFEKSGPIDVHLGDQRHPIFLLDQPGSVLADFLASSTESAHLMAMQDLLREKMHRAKRRMTELEKEQAGAAAGLDALAGLPELSLGLEELRGKAALLQRAVARAPALAKCLERLEGARERRAALDARTRKLARLDAPPRLEETRPLALLNARGRILEARRQRALAAHAVLGSLRAAPRVQPAGDLADTWTALRLLADKTLSARARAGALSELAPPPPQAPADALAALLKHLGQTAGRADRAACRARVLASVPAAPVPAPTAPLAGLVQALAGARRRLNEAAQRLEERAGDLSRLEAAIAARLGEVGQCPLCGAGLEAGRFFRQGETDAPAAD